MGYSERGGTRIAEEMVEEWLNRQEYFTIRGIKMGVHEIDLLAVKWQENRKAECRHIEVHLSSPSNNLNRTDYVLQDRTY